MHRYFKDSFYVPRSSSYLKFPQFDDIASNRVYLKLLRMLFEDSYFAGDDEAAIMIMKTLVEVDQINYNDLIGVMNLLSKYSESFPAFALLSEICCKRVRENTLISSFLPELLLVITKKFFDYQKYESAKDFLRTFARINSNDPKYSKILELISQHESSVAISLSLKIHNRMDSNAMEVQHFELPSLSQTFQNPLLFHRHIHALRLVNKKLRGNPNYLKTVMSSYDTDTVQETKRALKKVLGDLEEALLRSFNCEAKTLYIISFYVGYLWGMRNKRKVSVCTWWGDLEVQRECASGVSDCEWDVAVEYVVNPYRGVEA